VFEPVISSIPEELSPVEVGTDGPMSRREQARDRFLVVSTDGTVTWESPEGWARGTRLVDFVHPKDRRAFGVALAAATSDPGSQHTVKGRVAYAAGDWRPAELTIATHGTDSLVTIRETFGHPEAAADLVRRANQDSLTELANRAALQARLRAAEAGSGDASIALLYLDVDHFKRINDRHGHPIGDRVLRTVAERLRAAIRPGDMVARIGGDEFVVVAAEVSRDEVAAEIAERIRASMALPIRVGGRHVTATVSVGVAVGSARQATALLEHADAALYRAKGLGRNRAERYQGQGGGRHGVQPAIDEVLGEALDRDGLIVVYQPIIELASRRVVAVEALLRLRSDHGPLQTPDALLHLAEESGLIVSLGAGLLDQACYQAATWSEMFTDKAADTPNLVWPMSTRHVEQPRAADQALAILDAHGIPSHRLWVEVTERSLARPGPNARRNLDRLLTRGVHLVVQDFGAGPASLAWLRSFSPDAVKLDAMFMVGFGRDPRSTALVTGIVALCRPLGTAVVAQGVKDAAQVDHLEAIGCDQAQGSFFGDPGSAENLALR
jgi:diguanylate cyclase (GGDEF)-like protein